jgi:hypothetical protein
MLAMDLEKLKCLGVNSPETLMYNVLQKSMGEILSEKKL